MKTKKQDKILKHINTLSDFGKWIWLQENQNLGVIVYLDNDQTYFKFPIANGQYENIYFDTFVGRDEGIFILLDAMGIKCDNV